MSRVGKKPIHIPSKTQISYVNKMITVKGEKGSLSGLVHSAVELNINDGVITVSTLSDDINSRALQGLTRSLVNNMIIGVNKGFERVLEINGIGYRAEIKGNSLVLSLGFSHPVTYELPTGIQATVEKNTVIKLSGIDKEKLGLAAATIRRLKPPEPYKGKGIKYAEEHIQKKAGKTGTK